MAIGTWEGTTMLWDPTSRKLMWTRPGPRTPVTSVAFSPDGKQLAVASLDGTIRVLHPQSGEVAYSVQDHPPLVTSVTFSPDGKRLVAASIDRTVRLFPLYSAQRSRISSG